MNNRHIVIIDHFDSFTYNLVVAFEKLGTTVKVVRTNEGVQEVRKAEPTHIVLSPGPGHPRDVPLFQEVLERWKEHTPILGVCLGHQAIGLHFGAKVERSKAIMHGKTSLVTHSGVGIFEGVSNPVEVCRYHSLAIVEESIPQGTLVPTARSEDGTIMGVVSQRYPHVVGVQFHPESYFTKCGSKMLANFLKMKV